MTILVSILVLGILIFVHELGHFLLAKINNIGVFEFSIGFGKKLWRRRIGDTYYALGVIPLGGYVSMAGDDPALLERKAKELIEENDTEASASEDPLAKKLLENEETWFLKKSYVPKLSVVLAGPLFNYFFAIILAVISFICFGAMKPVSDPVIGDVMPGFAAEKAGILPNDRVLSINGIKMENWEQLADYISVSKGEEMDFYIERTKPERENDAPTQKEHLNLKVTASLDFKELATVQGEKNDRYRIGISQSFKRE
ncbi:MAG: PDZ domain-containing protein, partial [SAR324 cluster bacterium]|nr:PDZ domain-containing protein [SAR324 cluster bacterium]